MKKVLITAVLTFAFTGACPALTATIDFEDLAPDTLVYSQYHDRGVSFPDAPRIVEPAAGTASPTKALTKIHPGQEFDSGPLTIEFALAQSSVSMTAGILWPSAGLTWDAELIAYDAGGLVVATDMVILPPGPAPITTSIGVTTANKVITKVDLLYVSSAFETIDDLTYSDEGPFGGSDTTAPQVVIEVPIDGQHLDTFVTTNPTFALDGYVLEETMLQSLTIDVLGPGGQSRQGSLSFYGNASRYEFGSPQVTGLIYEGRNEITITAEDFGGNVDAETIVVWFEPLRGDAELLILTPTEFRAPLMWLKAWKDMTGISTAIVSLESIETDPRMQGNHDLPEKIKRSIAYGYEHHGTRYVLLVGDVDKFPVRYIRLGTQGVSWGVCWAPSDLYYADLFDSDGNFNDWDANQNNVFGEWGDVATEGDTMPDFAAINLDGCDLRPDVAVGRIPASSDHEVTRYVAKALGYELNFSGSWFSNSLLFNGDSDWSNDHGSLDWVAANTLAGFSHQKCYRPSNYESLDAGSKATAKAAMRQCVFDALGTGVGFSSFFGHGGHNTMGWIVNQSDVSTMSNSNKLPVFYARACDTAKFHYIYDAYEDIAGSVSLPSSGWADPRPEPQILQPASVDVDSMAEAMLLDNLSGAVGYIGAHSGVNSAQVPLAERFFESWDAGHHRLGDMWNSAVVRFADEVLYTNHWISRSPFQSHHIHKFLLFGDPSLRLGGIPVEYLAIIRDADLAPETLEVEIADWLRANPETFRELTFPRFSASSTVTLAGITSAQASVQLHEGERVLGQTQANLNGEFSFDDLSLDDGEHQLILSLGRRAGKKLIRIGVFTSPPAVRNVVPCSRCSTRGVLVTGETDYDGTKATLYADGRVVATDNARHGGIFVLRPGEPLSMGEHLFTLALEDGAGNISQVEEPIAIDVVCEGEGCEAAIKSDGWDCGGIVQGWACTTLLLLLLLVLFVATLVAYRWRTARR